MKKIFAIIFILLIFLSFNNGFNSIRTVRANTITVPDDYPTIQVAIAHANDGDTVFVKNGIYYTGDNNLIIIDKTISLIGEDPEKTIISGLFSIYIGSTPAIRVGAPNVTISGFTITNCRTAIAIANYYDESFPSGCKIIYNNIVNNSEGIRPQRSDLLIHGNNITNNKSGIKGWNTKNIIVSDNNISHNENFGVDIGICRNITICGNTISNNTGGLNLVYYGPHFVYGNNITNNDWGLRFAEGCSNAKVYGNIIANNSAGVVLLIFPNEGDVVFSGVGNKVFGNIFVDNFEQVVQNEGEFGYLNLPYSKGTDVVLWDNGTVGNYWGDYLIKYSNASEMGNSGVGDTPYFIDGVNIDYFPLVIAFNVSSTISLISTPIPTPNPEAKPLPVILVVISIVVIIVGGLGLIVYFKKNRS